MKKLTYLFLALLIFACTTDDNNNVDNSNTLEKEWLYTHTALEATATSSNTIVMPFTEDIFAFTDRPNREHKYISGDEFASYWNDYDDENSFKLDPPNAVLTWVDVDGVSEVEVVITDANFDGNNVIYTIENTTITANQSFEDVSLFVDGNGSGNNVYLASNGVTIKACAGAVAGDFGIVNGVGYYIVDLPTLNFFLGQGDDVTKVCTSLITDMSGVFANNTNFNQDISSWDVSNVTDMSSLFYESAFNQDISFWDVSKVIDMSSMFYGAPFNQDISSWDVSNVTDMSFMFNGTPFNQDISSWDVSNVTKMYYMLAGTPFNQNISTWDVSSVTDMSYMLEDANAFNQPIGNWDVSNVTDMSFMFSDSLFNQDISNWDVSNVTNMDVMFFSNENFNQDISLWDTSNVSSMSQMFQFADAFNQDLSSWNVNNVTNCIQFNALATQWTLPKPNFTNCTP
jgi:surface protein